MTIDAAVEVFARFADVFIENTLVDFEHDLLIDDEFDDGDLDIINEAVGGAHLDLLAWRRETLREFRAWLVSP